MPSLIFNTQKAQQASNAWTSEVIKLALVGSAYMPDPDAASLQAALGVHEPAAGGGYSRKALTARSVARDDAADEARYHAADVVYIGANFGTVKGGIVYKELDPADDALNVPIAYCELDTPITTDGGVLTFQFSPEGVFKAT